MNTDKEKNIIQRFGQVFSNLSKPEDKTPSKPVVQPVNAPTVPVHAAAHKHVEHKPQGPSASFYGLGIAPRILESLAKLKFTEPTPIQHKAIPIALEGKDLIGVAQTGTGKTLAFCIPMYQRLAQISKNGLILLPTRELALQVDEVFRKVGHAFGIKTAVLIGGAPMGAQISALRAKPRIIIATPGRLLDHLQQRNVTLSEVSLVVLDEADRMLDMGFAPQIDRVLQSVTKDRQTMLFSATLPAEILRIVNRYMKLPVSIEIAPSGTVAENIDQKLFVVNKESKLKLLEKIVRQYTGSILLFTRTKHGARNITQKLRNINCQAAEIHSNRSLSQRREALDGFRSGKYRILVATDIASRGIDVKNIELVINYDIPEDPENYVHRIGRTGRIGAQGQAITFATREQYKDVKNIERLIKNALPVSSHPDIPSEAFFQPSNSFVLRNNFRRPRTSMRRR
ncbi:MAG: DEAD/DEAH box helicase [Elusimicrobiota bacterium]